ncbi:hypothetical protein [Corynebacterium ulceribovis]|uniref:hypothetical protein n=1 Tax=Corynebacterium ulceribovis TaxID=487732 RepID=UPI00036CD854|nr:hypothetical protein [Corynebacterium ulceribovis]
MTRLYATAGELTIVRRLAAIAFGEWKVDWPDSVPEDQRPTLADDREHGFVSRLAGDAGRMGRRFVRADITITAAEFDEHGDQVPHTGHSNAEAILDAALEQTAEEAVIERDITRAGLRGAVPGKDFWVGKMVDVVVWDRVLPLPVTAIEAVTQAGAVIDWSVTVGGQLVSDDAGRRRANAELERSVWAERRQRLRDVERVESRAREAKTVADGAVEAAAGAALDAQVADTRALEADRKAEQSLEQWRAAKDELDQMQSRQIELNRRYIAALNDIQQVIGRESVRMISAKQDKWAADDYVRLDMPSWRRRLKIQARSSWQGTGLLNVRYSGGSVVAYQIEFTEDYSHTFVVPSGTVVGATLWYQVHRGGSFEIGDIEIDPEPEPEGEG